MDLKATIREIPDFPKKGIIFYDLTTLFKNPVAYQQSMAELLEHYRGLDFNYIVGIEARGFIIGAPLAIALNKGFIPIRKPGKLPAEIISASYDLEYGSNSIEIHQDAIKPGDKVLLVDDLLATGGTIKAAIDLIEGLGGELVSIGFLLELEFLSGRKDLEEYNIFSLLKEKG